MEVRTKIEINGVFNNQEEIEKALHQVVEHISKKYSTLRIKSMSLEAFLSDTNLKETNEIIS